MQILGLIVIGIIIGVIARLVLPGRQRIGAWFTVLLGIAGALIGGLIASALGTGDIFELNLVGTIVGIIAAAGLIGAAERAGIGEERRRDALKPGGRRHRDTLKPSSPTRPRRRPACRRAAAHELLHLLDSTSA